MRQLAILSLLIPFFLPIRAFAECEGSNASALYRDGCINEARAQFLAELESSRKSLLNVVPRIGGQKKWQALINIAWFEDEVGEHAQAIEYSNQALALASEMKDDFMIGRSLSWIGWAYSHQGNYELAEQFYMNALDIGAPQGHIRYPMIWGLSKQELGALKFKMGDTDQGAKLVGETYRFAKGNNIDIGVAEGGVHLAEISLAQGNLGAAASYAKEAAEAAERCNCGPQKVSRAKLAGAKVAFERSRAEPEFAAEAKRQAEETRDYAVKISDPHTEAEAMLILARLEPTQNFSYRYDYVTKALEKLTSRNSEIRGLAELEVGRTLVEEGKPDLAKFYLDNGVRVNNEMLRKVDKSFALTELGKVEGLKGNQREYLEKTEAAFNAAIKSGSKKDAFESAQILALEYDRLGYSKLSLKYAQKALKLSEQMISSERDSTHRRSLSEKQLELAEVAGANAAAITHGSDFPGE